MQTIAGLRIMRLRTSEARKRRRTRKRSARRRRKTKGRTSQTRRSQKRPLKTQMMKFKSSWI